MVIKDGVLISIHKADLTTDGSLYIPESVNEVGENASRNVSEILKRLVFAGDKTLKIGRLAFYDCKHLQEVIINNGLEIIGDEAFEKCRELNKINLPSNLKKICDGAFSGCTNLCKIELPDSLQEIGSSAFMLTGIINLTVPVNCTEIGASAFWNCKNLYDVTILSPLKKLNAGLFNFCECLTYISLPDTITVIEAEVFSHCRSLQHISLPDSLVKINSYAFLDTKSLYEIQFPKKLKNIGKRAFCYSGLKNVLLNNENDITSIGECCFRGCENLRYAGLSGTKIKNINYGIFSDCSVLDEILLPKTIRLICGKSFFNCSELETLTIPKKAEIEIDAFKNCIKLKEIKEF